MNQTVKPPLLPNCYGKICNRHAQCQRWQAVNGSIGHPRTIGTCLDGNGDRPLFVAVEVQS
jgi:hypothetical protein